MNYISVFIFISLALGIIASGFISLSLPCLMIIAAVFLLLSRFYHTKNNAVLFDVNILCLFFFLGLIWIKPYNTVLPKELSGKEVYVLARIESGPKEGHNFNSYLIEDSRIIYENREYYFSPAISVRDYSRGEVEFLDYYIFRGRLKEPFYRNPRYTIYLKSGSPPSLVRRSRGLRKLAYRVSLKTAGIIKNYFSPDISSFILSIFLGLRQELSKGVKDVFRRGGTSHILAISGLHVGIISGILMLMLKIAGVKFRPRLILTMALILIYAFICQFRSPILRASVMFFCFCLSFLSKRKFLVFNSLALAGIIDLFFRPDDIFTAGFQFSFIAVFFIALGFRYFYKPGASSLIEGARVIFFMSLFANLGLLPLVSFYFGKIYIINIVTNILVIPFLGVIISCLLVFLGFSFLAFLAPVTASACSYLIFLFVKINYVFAQVPFSYFSYRFSRAEIFFYYLILFGLALVLRLIQKKPPPWLRAGSVACPAKSGTIKV